MSAVRTVKLYNREGYERKRLTTMIHDLAETLIDTSKKSLLVQPISQAVIGTLLIGVVFFAVWVLVLPGKLDVALLLAFLFALFRLMPTVHQLNQQRGVTGRGIMRLSRTSSACSTRPTNHTCSTIPARLLPSVMEMY